ncbi:tryptophan 5-hydroxylase 1-like [Convolutriloba macropyga]
MEDSSKQKEFSLDGILDMTCNITTFQDGYFVNSSFETAKAEMKNFASSIQRGFDVKYNPFTRSIDVLKTSNDYLQALNAAQQEVNQLIEGMQRQCSVNNSHERSEKRLGLNSGSEWSNFIENL